MVSHRQISPYRGRFAPSPTGPLHAGSLVAALASWLDARAHAGVWLVRIEDVDTTRCLPGMDETILRQLAACGLHSDEAVAYQSRRGQRYEAVLQQLLALDAAYPCACTRKDIAQALLAQGTPKGRDAELVYPGTCAQGLRGRHARAWRFRAQAGQLHWWDRRLGPQQQDVRAAVGDFVLKRADGCFAYQLAVVVDDADQGITDLVRGLDLSDNTARQIQLQQALGFKRPRYLHTPLVLGDDGCKLSKQNGAQAVATDTPEAAAHSLCQAALALDLPLPTRPMTSAALLAQWVPAWQARWRDLAAADKPSDILPSEPGCAA